MLQFAAKALVNLSLALKQPLASFCDIETSHDDALVTKKGDYVSVHRIDGMRNASTRQDIVNVAMAQRVDLSGSLDGPGHAIVGCFASDPQLTAGEIDRRNLDSCRMVAAELGLNMDVLLNERAELWPKIMRWESAHYVIWTRRVVLTKEERKQVKEEQNELARQWSRVGSSQRFYLRSDIMAARHGAFVSRVVASLHNSGVATTPLDAHEALTVAREMLYRETAGSKWKATLVGDRVMPRLQEEGAKPHPEGMLWPSIASQIFHADAVTKGGQRVEIGDYEYSPVDMSQGPEDPRPFIELMSALGKDRIPWRCSIILEGGGNAAMSVKSLAAEFLGIFPNNGPLRRAFDMLRREREENNHSSVKLRASFATWASPEDRHKLRRRSSLLTQRVEGWGNCKATAVSGDPLECAMSSVPLLALASTAAPHGALLGDAFTMLPGNRPGSPWEAGSVLFRRPDGAIWPYDPSGGSKRPQVLDIFIAPPRSGKSVLANTINLGLCLSTAVMGSKGAKLPLIGKVDIGPSAQGFVTLLQEALGTDRAHEAIFVPMQLGRGYEFNIFDLQVCCDYPLPLEQAFLENFLTLGTLPADTSTPYEGVTQMIGLAIDEAYRLCTPVPGGSPKKYKVGVEPLVDAALASHGIVIEHEEPWWRDIVRALFDAKEYRLAEIAQRYAVPVIGDLISAVGTDHVRDMFSKLKISQTHEDLVDLFKRYIYSLIKKYPSLNSPTKLDFGSARVIVMDLAAIAPTGSASANRQTEMMYMLARHILARNFFLHPDYAENVPEFARDYHRQRFTDVMESIKRLDYDEWHRTDGSPQVRAQAQLDVREGPKHNIQLGFASQRMRDMGDGITSQATGRFVLKAGDEAEAAAIIERFNLSDASAAILRHELNGPGPSGAPFLAILDADGEQHQQMLVNSLGPIELWALSTTPGDTAVRRRLYSRLGFSEALRRLAKVYPHGSALKEIERRKKDRLKHGDNDARAEMGVVDEIANELINGDGFAIVLRDGEGARPGALALAAE